MCLDTWRTPNLIEEITMSKPNRETFRKLTPAQQRASIAGGEAGTKAKKEVYQQMKQQRKQGNTG